jgi:hypothetical protein
MPAKGRDAIGNGLMAELHVVEVGLDWEVRPGDSSGSVEVITLDVLPALPVPNQWLLVFLKVLVPIRDMEELLLASGITHDTRIGSTEDGQIGLLVFEIASGRLGVSSAKALGLPGLGLGGIMKDEILDFPA